LHQRRGYNAARSGTGWRRLAPAGEVSGMDELIDRLQGLQQRIDDLLVRL